LLTGISYQHFNFLHRWVGRWIFIFTVIHTVFWTIELGVMYQPQPERYQNTWKKRYWKYGVGATSFATYLFLHSLRSVRRLTGYEFFRKTHELIAVLFLGACWGHWPQMREWMIAGIAIVFFDRIIRYLRIFFIHMNWTSSEKGSFGLHAFEGTIVRHHDPEDNVDVLILRLSKATVKYEVGQHFFLTFPTLSLFESHPFTPSNYASKKSDNGLHEQIYVIRVLSGQTHRLAKVCREPKVEYTIPTVCAGPYGATDVLDNGAENIQLVAGGTGVSFTLPFAMKLVADAKNKTAVRAAAKRIDFVWIVRRDANVDWIREYLISLQKEAKSSGLELFVRIFVTRGNISHSKKGIDSSNSGSLTSPIPSSSSSIGEKDFITKVYPGDMTAAGAAGKELSVTTKPEVVSNEKANASVALAYNAESWAQTECRPQIAYIVRWFWEEKCASGRVQVLGSGPAGMGSDLRNAVAACNVPEMVRRGEERGAVGCWWDAREY
ncbi:ferric reductase like transmembrane component-domain-containing protein, partial [Kalaharituber pfeilii]